MGIKGWPLYGLSGAFSGADDDLVDTTVLVVGVAFEVVIAVLPTPTHGVFGIFGDCRIQDDCEPHARWEPLPTPSGRAPNGDGPLD